jgi:single-stranded-DNA-specific exonuclease
VTAEAFLGVETSVSGRRWVSRLADERAAAAIAQRCELPDILARILAARRVPVDEAERFLNPTLRTLMPQPSAVRDLQKGAERLADAVVAGESIGVITDYDVDGVSSAALLVSFLQAAGSDAMVRIPDRLTEGYGPSVRAVQELRERGASLLVTLDCGVLAHDPLSHAGDIGFETIVVDHHQASPELPLAHAVINPNRQDDTSGFGYLCAAGVTMLLVAVTNGVLRRRGWYSPARPEPNMLQWLELVALATICDVVPLVGLNRAYVTQGLKIMARRQNAGLAALADMARLKRPPDTYALGFVLGPRLNAAGRVGHAQDALDLLMTRDPVEAQHLAQNLENLNRDRQATEQRVIAAAAQQAESMLGQQLLNPVLLLAGEDWHPGVLGLAAARIKDRYQRPAFALFIDRQSGTASGSGRSVPGADIGVVVRKALSAGLLTKGGGHAMAAGLTVALDRLAELRGFLEAELGPLVDLAARRTLEVDGALSAGGATLELLELVEQAGPYGTGNPSPVFVLPAHRVIHAARVGADHVRCTAVGPGKASLKCIAFRALGSPLGELLLSERQAPLHLAGRLVIDEWGTRRIPAFQIEDAAIAQ